MLLSSWSSSCMCNKNVYFKQSASSLTYFVFQNGTEWQIGFNYAFIDIASADKAWWRHKTDDSETLDSYPAHTVRPTCKSICTYNQSMLSAHCDDRAVDDPQQRHHDVLDMLECFSLRQTKPEYRRTAKRWKRRRDKEKQKIVRFLRCKRTQKQTNAEQLHSSNSIDSGRTLMPLPGTSQNFFSMKLKTHQVLFVLLFSPFMNSPRCEPSLHSPKLYSGAGGSNKTSFLLLKF